MICTHLQFKVLSLILDSELSGKEIRDQFSNKKSLPAFYQMMARLERSNLIKKERRKSRLPVTECWYQITEKGRSAIQESLIFYEAPCIHRSI